MSTLKKFFEQFFLINDTPHKIAAGTALGIFLGIVPGEGVITTLVLASVFKLNRLASVAGVVATNMWGTLVVLPLAALVGSVLSGNNASDIVYQFQNSYHLGFKFFMSKAILFDMVFPLVFGFILVAGLIALTFYMLIFFLLKSKKITFVK